MPPFVPLTSPTRPRNPSLGGGPHRPTAREGASAWHQSPERRVKASRTHVASRVRGLGFPTAASLLSRAAAAPPGVSLEGRA